MKKGFFNFDCFWCGCFRFVCKNDFLKEIKRFCNHFPQKLKGLLVKVGLFLSFGAFACGY
ncbi:hypothetical protein EC585_03105 [Helicobacter pylori]|nr:hypothetical protein EC585_03105 [Helicobacter pylori]